MDKRIVSLICLVIITFAVLVPSVAAVQGPNMAKLLIHIYSNPDAEFTDFELGTVEITDWPATKYYLDRWRLMPWLTLRSYAEIGMMQFDINNQRWPTGWGEPLEYDPRTDTYKHYYNDSDPTDINHRRDWCAKEFRKAIAWLSDKARYVREVLGGLGYACETFVPVPALAGYTDYDSLRLQGLIYEYDKDEAIRVLNNAGFQDWDGDGSRDDWKDPGPDLTIGTADDGDVEINSLRRYHAEGLLFYIRMDDPNRRQMGELLAAELESVKIPVKKIITERTVCFRQVMVLYDYHIYTGGWSLGAVPEWLHTIWNSEFYWAPIGWSSNYDGWCNKEYDEHSLALYQATDLDTFKEEALKCQEIMARYVGHDPLFTSAAVKGFWEGYSGVVADVGYGVDNYFSFLTMVNTTDKTIFGTKEKLYDDVIDYGFKSDIEGVHVISSEWLWDWNVIGLIYESLISRPPYDKAIGSYYGWLAYNNFTVGTWGDGFTEINFTIRENVFWQDGEPFTAEDVVFSLEFTRHCGKGVAWNFAAVQYLNSTWAEGNKVIVRLNIAKPLTGQEDPGMLPIIPKHIWEPKFPDWEDWFNEATGEWQPFTPGSGRARVRDWKPWEEEHPVYNSTNPHPQNGILTKAIGTGAWIFEAHVEGQYVSLHANRLHYFTAEGLRDEVKYMFWAGMGDANHNMIIDGGDLGLIRAYWASNYADCDFNKDGVVDDADHVKASGNYGRPG
jgi:ABC-type transport system substrate-binding protein